MEPGWRVGHLLQGGLSNILALNRFVSRQWRRYFSGDRSTLGKHSEWLGCSVLRMPIFGEIIDVERLVEWSRLRKLRVAIDQLRDTMSNVTELCPEHQIQLVDEKWIECDKLVRMGNPNHRSVSERRGGTSRETGAWSSGDRS